MRSLSLTRKCRPIRLGFLVRPGNRADLTRAVEINTTLWGGVFNPLIPFYRRVPATWRGQILGRPSALDILRGYIATFQPDFLVKPADVALPSGVFSTDRTLDPTDVVRVPQAGEYVASRSPIAYGLDMMDVYCDAYRKVHRFTQRNPRQYQIPTLRGRLRLVGGFIWGAFPAESDLDYYSREFAEVFQAEAKVHGAISTLLPGIGTPLKVTAYQLEPSGRAPEPSVFLFDENQPGDLIDFWNLRACGGLCIPLPLSAVAALTPEVTQFMQAYLRRWAINDTQLTYPHLISSRSLKQTAVRDVIASLGLDRQHRLVWAHYPRLWAKQEASWDQATPVAFHCEDEFRQTAIEGDRLTFDALHPNFAARFGKTGPRWMNVVNLDELQPEALPASIIPDGIERVARLVGHFGRPGAWASDEGIAVPCEHTKWRHHWKLPTASQVGLEWARAKGYEYEVSDSGHILQSMVDVAGGLFHGRWFANTGIIRALGKMAKGHVVAAGEFRGLVKTANEREKFLKDLTDRHLEYFEEKGVLRLCLKVQCPHCRQYPWYTLEELAHRVECRHCLREFAFPVAAPLRKWGYRSVGPFASAGYAQGAYCTLLALRFLSEQLEARTTCVPSFKLTKDGQTGEIDFLCFWQKHSWRDPGRHIIFGECKCFDEFEGKEVRRMKDVATRCPGSIAAFCTLRDRLSAREQRIIGDFAKSGRRPRAGMSWPTPVLVLTANELCVMTPQEFYHRCLAGDGAGLAARMPRGDLNMPDLCSASQQEYLGLSSWHDWIKQFYDYRAKRKKGRPQQGPVPVRGLAAGQASEVPQATDTTNDP